MNSSKTTVADLALFGGPPAFEDALHVGRPNIGSREGFAKRLSEIFDSRWLTNDGYNVREFERRIAGFVGVEHCVVMCNATVALEIAIRALRMTGEVIIPSLTFIATAHALQWQGITPVFCDINPQTHTLDPNKLEEMITPRTSGIIGVHLWGRPCEIDALSEISKRRGLKLVFDSAHAFGCSYRGRMIGAFGDAEVFSFHATKFINSLEGGAVVTNDGQLAHEMRLMRNFGFTNYDYVESIGTNGKMNEVAAAMGLTNLESIDEFIDVNRRNYKQYAAELADLKGITVLTYDESEKCNYQYVVLEIDERQSIVNRDQLIEILHSENVLARRYFYPGCHRMEPYKALYPNTHLFLPHTERVSAQVMSLPTGQAITPEDIRIVCNIIVTAFANAGEIHRLLEEKAGA